MNEILENVEVMEGIVTVTSPEELAKLFDAYNIQLEKDLTIEKAFELVKAQESGGLTEVALDDVSGGVVFSAVAAFTLSAAALHFIAGYAYQRYKNSKGRR